MCHGSPSFSSVNENNQKNVKMYHNEPTFVLHFYTCGIEINLITWNIIPKAAIVYVFEAERHMQFFSSNHNYWFWFIAVAH